MERAARRISEEMDLLELHQQYMRQREIRHRQSTSLLSLSFDLSFDLSRDPWY